MTVIKAMAPHKKRAVLLAPIPYPIANAASESTEVIFLSQRKLERLAFRFWQREDDSNDVATWPTRAGELGRPPS